MKETVSKEGHKKNNGILDEIEWKDGQETISPFQIRNRRIR